MSAALSVPSDVRESAVPSAAGRPSSPMSGKLSPFCSAWLIVLPGKMSSAIVPTTRS